LRADSLPKAAFPGGRLWGFAMAARGRGKVGEGFDPDAKRGRVEIVCECRGGEEVCEKRVLSLGRNQAPYIGIFLQP